MDDTGFFSVIEGDPSRVHAERLPAELLQIVREAGLALADIDVFGVVCGPGGFTGLRVGIASIQGLAAVTGRRIVPVSTLQAMAVQGSELVTPGATIGVWMDARRGEVFTARWQLLAAPAWEPSHLVELDPPALELPDDARRRWATAPPALIAGDGAMLHQDLARSISKPVEVSRLALAAARIAMCAAADDRLPAGKIQPSYIRRPDAEVLREQRQRTGDPLRSGPV